MNELIKLLPGLLDFIQQFYDNRKRLPTVEELQRELTNNLNTHIAIGEAWLKSHPQDSEKESSQN